MRAAFVSSLGPAESIEIGQLPIPTRGQSEVLVAVEVVAVNLVDTLIRAGRWSTSVPFPLVMSRDLVGTVVDGDDAGTFAPGDRVWANSQGHGGRQGVAAEYAVVPADRLYRLPAGVDPVAAVASFHPAATAFLGLHRRVPLDPGDIVLVGGGGGSVGCCAIQLAVAAGARVIATASPADHDRCRRLGAEVVLDYRDAGLVPAVLSAAPGGVEVHWDTSGQGLLATAVELVRPGGHILITAGRRMQPPTALWPLYSSDITVIGFVISRATAAELADAAKVINTQLAGPGFAVAVADVLPLERIAEAHQLVESGRPGRAVIRISPSPQGLAGQGMNCEPNAV